MGLEQKVNYFLNRFPAVKRVVKRAYQRTAYTFSKKIKAEGEIVRVSPGDGKEYFFGYYDKSPWDASGRYMLSMRAADTSRDVAPKEPAEIILIDTEDGSWRTLAVTHAWNVQQGCMAGWLGPDFGRKIIYNDFRDGKFVSVILDVFSGEERVLPLPVYTVANDGSFALSIDFSRLHRLRPGYGYSNLPDATEGERIPAGCAVYRMEIPSGEVSEILSYEELTSFEPRPEMEGAVHKVNHPMLSPDGERFVLLHRWFCGQRKYTRLVTLSSKGGDLYNLSDDDMVSHTCWKNSEEIFAFENKRDGGPGYYLMRDKTREYVHLFAKYSNDGHPTYSPDGRKIVTDSYPDRARIADVKLLSEEDPEAKNAEIVARVFAPFRYDNDTRCDLHPRWKRDGSAIAIDSVFEGHRELYVIPVRKEKTV